MKKILPDLLAALIIAFCLWIAICVCIILGRTAFADERDPGLSENEIAAAIKAVGPENEKLSQYAKEFSETDDPLTLVSIAAIESGWGRSKLGRNNLFGIKHKNEYIRFEDKDGCHPEWTIAYTDWALRTRFKNCDSITDIGRTYSGTPEAWTGAVMTVYEKLKEAAERNTNEKVGANNSRSRR